MNILLAVSLFTSVNLYFLKNSQDLLVRVIPPEGVYEIVLYYSFSGDDWHSRTVQSYEGMNFDAAITPPESLSMIGVYYTYDVNSVINTDDNKGMLYLYEVKKSPRMLMPFSMDIVEPMLKQARKKIDAQKHVDEAIALLDYVDAILRVLPFRKGSDLEIKKPILEAEANELRQSIK
ncbi:MAG TPA: hypothetical protein VF399_13125 [bacterium]|jgi:hypothetical protein